MSGEATEAPPVASQPETTWQRIQRHRRRIGTGVLLVLLFLLATHGSQVLPSTLELAIPISDPASVTRIEATLLDETGEEAHRVVRRFAGDAPELLELDTELLPARYDLEVRTTRTTGESLLLGAVEVPSEGRVRVRLHAPGDDPHP